MRKKAKKKTLIFSKKNFKIHPMNHGFEKAGNFLFLAAKKFHLENEAKSALICHRIRTFLQNEYQDLAQYWNVKKYEKGVLFISTKDSASRNELYLRTHEILENISEEEKNQIHEIRITR